jgi:hypothetical protein
VAKLRRFVGGFRFIGNSQLIVECDDPPPKGLRAERSKLRVFFDTTSLKFRSPAFGATLLKCFVIGGCAIAVLFIAASIYAAMIFMGWGAKIPAQVQVTLDRKETSYDDVLTAFVSAAARQGYSLDYQGAKPTTNYGLFMDKAKSIYIDIGSSSANIDPMFSVIDLNNANKSIHVAKAMTDELSRSFTIKRIYVQVDSRQYDCLQSACTFEMSSPINVDKLPRWLGKM